VLDIVVLGELHQLSKAQHVVVGARRLQCDLLGGLDELEVARLLQVIEPADLTSRDQAIPQQLRDAHAGSAPVQALVGRTAAVVGVARVAGVCQHIHPRVVSTARDVDLIVCCTKGIEAGRYFGVGLDRFLRCFAKRIAWLRERAADAAQGREKDDRSEHRSVRVPG